MKVVGSIIRSHVANMRPNMLDLDSAVTDTAVYAGPTPSAQAWFAGGERIGYDPKARAIVAAQEAPLKIFLRREGDLAHAIAFLPGYPDGSFGWAKVRRHLPNAAEMPKLFVDYVGMGDSDKPKGRPRFFCRRRLVGIPGTHPPCWTKRSPGPAPIRASFR